MPKTMQPTGRSMSVAQIRVKKGKATLILKGDGLDLKVTDTVERLREMIVDANFDRTLKFTFKLSEEDMEQLIMDIGA